MSGYVNPVFRPDFTDYPAPQQNRLASGFNAIWPASNPVGTETTQGMQSATPTDQIAFMRPDGTPVMQSDLAAAHAQVQTAMQTAPTMVLGMMGTTEPMASRSGFLYNAPLKPSRSFEADYPTGAPSDATGRLTADIEGRPLGARFVAGRRAVGGVDEAVPPAQFDALAEAAIGRPPLAVASGKLQGDAGRFTKTADPVTGDAVYTIDTNRTLSPGGRDLAIGHELGHMVDDLVGQIDPKGLQPELGQVYNTLTTGQERTRGLTRPGDIGYGAQDAPRELIATAIHAYLTNPNYLKTVAPKVAEAIRAAVNNNPRLRDIIQFNAVGGLGLGLGATAAGTQQQSQ